MNYTELAAHFMIMIAILMGVVNVITEVVKLTINFKKPEHINFFVEGLSIVLTFGVLLAYWQIHNMKLTWYVIAAFLIIGYFVAYAAMLGFDKLWKNFENVRF